MFGIKGSVALQSTTYDRRQRGRSRADKTASVGVTSAVVCMGDTCTNSVPRSPCQATRPQGKSMWAPHPLCLHSKTSPETEICPSDRDRGGAITKSGWVHDVTQSPSDPTEAEEGSK